MSGLLQRLKSPATLAGLVFVVGLHGVVLWFALQHRIIAVPDTLEPLFVSFITPPKPPEPEPPPPPPKPKPPPPKPVKLEKPKPPEPHPHLVVEAPAAPNDYVAPPPPPPEPTPPAPVIEAPPAPPPPKPTGPVQISGDLSIGCPTRTAPAYPAMSRRMSESGKVVLRVELGVDGRVDTVKVQTSSGHKRLDDAAITAVKTWRCPPPTRDGEPVRAVALQPFNFNLE